MANINLDTKYRPKTFNEVLGQEVTVQILSTAIAEKKVRSANLFSGPSGVGKTTLGRILAQALLCESPVNSNPCMQCESCKLFIAERHYSYREYDAATFSKKEDMVSLRDEAFYHPTGGRKIILLDECHDISKAGQDALLDQFEDCPEYLTYILCTTDPDSMKDTLRNRCMEFQVSTIPAEKIVGRLGEICRKENFVFNDETLKFIVEKSEGRVRNAIKIMEKTSYLGEINTENVNKVFKGHDSEIFDVLYNLGTDLNASLLALRKVSADLSVEEIYGSILSMLTETAELVYGCDNQSPSRTGMLTNLKDKFGMAIIEFLNYLVSRNKYIDKNSLTGDIILLHYKFTINSFVPPTQSPNPINKVESSNIEKIEAKMIPQSELFKLPPVERNRIMRLQRTSASKEDDKEIERVPSEWPLPKVEKIGENSDDEVITPQEFSQHLVGGRSGFFK